MWYTNQELCYIYRRAPLFSMEMTTLNITDIFKQFARRQQELLREQNSADLLPMNHKLDPLLALCSGSAEVSSLRQALLDPQSVVAGVRFQTGRRG